MDESKLSIIVNDDSFTYQGVLLGITTGNIISIHFGNGGVIATPQSRRSIYLTNPIELDQWVHVVGIIKDNLNMDVYLHYKEQKSFYSGEAKKVNYNNS